MKTCPYCGSAIEENARFCLYCMKELTEKNTVQPAPALLLQRRRLLLLWGGILALMILGLVLLLAFPKDSAPAEDPVTQETGEPLQPEEGASDPENNNGEKTEQTPATNQGTPQTDPSPMVPAPGGNSAGSGNGQTPTQTDPAKVQTPTLTDPARAQNNNQGDSNPTQNTPTTSTQTEQPAPTPETSTPSNDSSDQTEEKSETGSTQTENSSSQRENNNSSQTETNSSQTENNTTGSETTPTPPENPVTKPETAPEESTEPEQETPPTVTAATYLYRDAGYGDDYYVHADTENCVVITGVATPASDGIYRIPSTIDGKTVLSVMGNAFSHSEIRNTVKQVYVPAGVKTIWNHAFAGCKNMTDIYFYGKSIYVDSYAFADEGSRTGTLTIHCSYSCSNRDFRYYRNIASLFGALYEEWNG